MAASTISNCARLVELEIRIFTTFTCTSVFRLDRAMVEGLISGDVTVDNHADAQRAVGWLDPRDAFEACRYEGQAHDARVGLAGRPASRIQRALDDVFGWAQLDTKLASRVWLGIVKAHDGLTPGRATTLADGAALFPAPQPMSELPLGYAETLRQLKARIQQTRLRAVLAANAAMIQLYWDLGHTILDRQASEGWGKKVIDRFFRIYGAKWITYAAPKPPSSPRATSSSTCDV
jgi:hypothetical protein